MKTKTFELPVKYCKEWILNKDKKAVDVIFCPFYQTACVLFERGIDLYDANASILRLEECRETQVIIKEKSDA